MDEDQLFELEYHDEMEVLAELENGKSWRWCCHCGSQTCQISAPKGV